MIFENCELIFVKYSTHLKYNSKEYSLLLYEIIDNKCVNLHKKNVTLSNFGDKFL